MPDLGRAALVVSLGLALYALVAGTTAAVTNRRRLADLWREAAGITDWSLEVVAAFMRAAYGKGYCDALTEEAPGSLCADHGYRVPERRYPARADATHS